MHHPGFTFLLHSSSSHRRRSRRCVARLLASKLYRKLSRLFLLQRSKKHHPRSAASSSRKHPTKPPVQRMVSWSRYMEAPGGEEAVESAEEWMVDMSQLLLGQRFASGTGSRLYHGIYQQNAVAVKVMKLSDEHNTDSNRLDNQFSREVSLLSRLQHDNIVEFVAACWKPPVCCIITEYLPGGSLRAFLNKTEPHFLSLQFVLGAALDVCKGMEYLHSTAVIHRDLKSENLLLTEDLRVKITDFGVSCMESEWQTMKGHSGTYRWMAPEMINENPYGRKVDVYSFGIILWELFTGLIPHAEMTGVQVAFAVSQKNARPAIPQGCPPALSELMQQCWSPDPDLRPEFSEIVNILLQIERTLKQKTGFSSTVPR